MPTNLPTIEKNEAPVVNQTYLFIENMVTLAIMLVLILGLAAIFHSWHCLWGLILMGNLNRYSKEKNDNDDD